MRNPTIYGVRFRLKNTAKGEDWACHDCAKKHSLSVVECNPSGHTGQDRHPTKCSICLKPAAPWRLAGEVPSRDLRLAHLPSQDRAIFSSTGWPGSLALRFPAIQLDPNPRHQIKDGLDLQIVTIPHKHGRSHFPMPDLEG